MKYLAVGLAHAGKLARAAKELVLQRGGCVLGALRVRGGTDHLGPRPRSLRHRRRGHAGAIVPHRSTAGLQGFTRESFGRVRVRGRCQSAPAVNVATGMFGSVTTPVCPVTVRPA
jgi:hypothetical protein